MRRAAFISYHTSPLDLPGIGDSGGLNVYVRDLTRELSKEGMCCDIFTRRCDPQTPTITIVGECCRVIQIDAGPMSRLTKSASASYVDVFTDQLVGQICADGYDILHSHYWLSGVSAMAAGAKLGLPVVHTAHTLSQVRALADGGRRRVDAEFELAARADMLIANTDHDARSLVNDYRADPDRVEIIAPGVDHSIFTPGDRNRARQASGLRDADLVLLYVGRVQRLKGANLLVDIVDRIGQLDRRLVGRLTLVVAGGPSGEDGDDTLADLRSAAARSKVDVRFAAPRPHDDLVDLYRSADLCVIPSRSESFGLVGIEAQASGIPIVASRVDGLAHVIRHGHGGILVDTADVDQFALASAQLLANDSYRGRLAQGAVADALRFSWRSTAHAHCAVYSELIDPGRVAVCG